jgi:hypothetical protein
MSPNFQSCRALCHGFMQRRRLCRDWAVFKISKRKRGLRCLQHSKLATDTDDVDGFDCFDGVAVATGCCGRLEQAADDRFFGRLANRLKQGREPIIAQHREPFDRFGTYKGMANTFAG